MFDEDSDSDDSDKNLDSDAIEALDEFSFLKQEQEVIAKSPAGRQAANTTTTAGKQPPPLPPSIAGRRPPSTGTTGTPAAGGGRGGEAGKWSFDQSSFEQVKEEFRRTMEDRRKLHQQGQSLDTSLLGGAGGGKGQQGRSPQEAALLRMLGAGKKIVSQAKGML